MKRREFLRHLASLGCTFLREGRRHTVYWNPLNRRTSTVPRHTEIAEFLASKICRDLGIPEP